MSGCKKNLAEHPATQLQEHTHYIINLFSIASFDREEKLELNPHTSLHRTLLWNFLIKQLPLITAKFCSHITDIFSTASRWNE